MKILVTGVAGFIGSRTTEMLLERGHVVRGVDALTDYYSPEIKWANLDRIGLDRFEFLHVDLNETDLDRALDGVDAILHLAGQPGVRTSWGETFDPYVRANVSATQRLLEAARRASVGTFVYASSSSIYGEAESFPTGEETLPHPLSPYGVTKLAGEHLCQPYARSFGIRTVALRYFTVYGPGQRPDMAFSRFIRAALADEEITVYGGGEQIRDFTYVDDVAAANILALTQPVPPGSVFNVAGGSSVSVNEIVATLSDVLGQRVRVSHAPAVPGDVHRTGGETRAIRAALGWRPTVGLDVGLRRQVEWLRTLPHELAGIPN